MSAATTLERSSADVDRAVERVTHAVVEHASEADDSARFPSEAMDEMRRTGLLGLLVPAAQGGQAGTVRDLVDVTCRLGRADMSAAMIFAMHCQQVAAIGRHAAEPLRSRLLTRVASGDLYLASVTTEIAKGGDLLTSNAGLDESGEELVVDRFAPVVTGGAHADGFLITMQAPGADSSGHVSLVFAERSQLEVTPVGGWQPMGMRASDSGPLRLQGRIPSENVVGGHGRFRDVVATTFGPLAHVGWSAAWLGTASGALARVVRLIRDPEARGSLRPDSELVLTRLATVRHRLEGVRALLDVTADAIMNGDDVTRPRQQLRTNALKVVSSEQCYVAVDELIETVGLRLGYMRGSQLWLERALRDLRSASLNYGNDRLRLADGKLTLLDSEVGFA